VETLEARETPAVFTVTNANSAGTNSLDWAIGQANANPGADEINFDSILFSTPKTITLMQSLPVINPDFDDDDAVTFTGPGAHLLTITRDANAGSFAMFNINDGQMKFSGMTISGGNNFERAGGIFQNKGSLLLENMVFANNKGVQGGAVHAQRATLVVRNSTFTNNEATNQGGAIYVRLQPAQVYDSTFMGNIAGVQGGGICSAGTDVHMWNTYFADNEAGDQGGGIYSSGTVQMWNTYFADNEAGNQGGGVCIQSSGDLYADNVTAVNNFSGYEGGGIFMRSGYLQLLNSTVTDNEAVLSGGGILQSSGNVLIQNSIVSGNTSEYSGAGIYIWRGEDVVIERTTISDNHSGYYGGGLYISRTNKLRIEDCAVTGNIAGGTGGGGGLAIIEIDDDAGNISPGILRNCTITGNTAGGRGGGVSAALLYNPLHVINCTITGNTSTDTDTQQSEGSEGGGGIAHSGAYGTMRIFNSVITGNTNPLAPDVLGRVLPIQIRNSAIGSSVGFVLAAGSGDNLEYGLDHNLGPLADNGGPTLTRHPAYDSPLINAGSNALLSGAVFDQRGDGFARIADSMTDIGAIELQPVFVTVEQANGQLDPTRTGPIVFAVTFSSAVSGFSESGVDFSGSTAGGVLEATVTGSGKDYIVSVSGMTSTGDIIVSIPLGAAVDWLGVPNKASTSNDNVVRYDIDRPTVTIEQGASQAEPTNASTITFDVEFNEPVTGFDDDDIDFTGSGNPGTLVANVVRLTSSQYTVDITGMTGIGTVVISIPALAATDDSGNSSWESTSLDNSVLFDGIAPTVTIDQGATQVDITNSSSIVFDVVFDEDVTGFTGTDISFAGSTVDGTLVANVVELTPRTYTVEVSGMDGEGVVVASIPAGRVSDLAGNGNDASTSIDHEVAFDNVGASVTINQSTSQIEPTNDSPIQFDVVFTVDVTGFDSDDVRFTGSSVDGTLVANVIEHTPSTYTVEVTGMDGTGDVVASILTGAAFDALGNPSFVSTSDDNSVLFDNDLPTVTIEQGVGQVQLATISPIIFDVVFNEPVSGFDGDDIDFSESTVGGSLVAQVIQRTPKTYTVEVTGMYGAGTVVASVLANAAEDAAGNLSEASTSLDNEVNYNGRGTLSFSAPTYSAAEGGNATITVTRTGGADGEVSITYGMTVGSATAGDSGAPDIAPGVLSWLDGVATPITITLPITNDVLSEGYETIHFNLSNPVGGPLIGNMETVLTIDPSDPVTIDASNKFAPRKFVDVDQDTIVVKFGGRTGSLGIYLTDDATPISLIRATGTDPLKSIVVVAVAKAKRTVNPNANGKTTIGAVDGSGLLAFNAPRADLTGSGIASTGFLRSVWMGHVLNGADIIVGAAPGSQKTKMTFATIGNGTDITVPSGIGAFSAYSFGDGAITTPNLWALLINGNFGGDMTLDGTGVLPNRPTMTLFRVSGSVLPTSTIDVSGRLNTVIVGKPRGMIDVFAGNLTADAMGAFIVVGNMTGDLNISGATPAPNRLALVSFKVLGNVIDSDIRVGGHVNAVLAAGFTGSTFFAGYDGPDDGSGEFSALATINSFQIIGATGLVADSSVIATTLKSVVLKSVLGDNNDDPFGFIADDSINFLKVLSTGFVYDPLQLLTQGFDDFEIRVLREN
jgi:predicted outer membrane repeat protein